MLKRRLLASLAYVPKHEPPTQQDINQLQHFVSSISKILVITGAGVSTESGIPDYRSEGVGLYARSDHRPMKIQEFLSSKTAQRRYWARNFYGWPRFAGLSPNTSHFTLVTWHKHGKLSGLVTQNVDGLHEKAGGSLKTIELHGSGHLVVCLGEGCGYKIDRQLFQNVLVDLNRHLEGMPSVGEEGAQGVGQSRPDGDVDLVEEAISKFILPSCPSCGGALKPDIVFFGDNVPRERVDRIYDILKESDGLLVLGSSLQTFSAFRYILSARQSGLPVGIVNLGKTRADEMCQMKIMRRVGEILPLIRLTS